MRYLSLRVSTLPRCRQRVATGRRAAYSSVPRSASGDGEVIAIVAVETAANGGASHMLAYARYGAYE